MLPVLFRIGSLDITSFGVMVALGALVGLWVFRRELLRAGLPEAALDAGVYGLVGGLLGAKLLYLSQYLKRAGRPNQEGKTIALIYGVGTVQRGENAYDPVTGEVAMGSETVAAAFRSAVRDKNVKAILFRVDSPGGSYVASDTIWRETVKAKQAGKPVVVSMGTLAGSGGYFVAMAANKIVAQPGTITASIGVLGGKMVTPGFWDKMGLSWDEVHTSANSTIWTGTHEYTPAEAQRLLSDCGLKEKVLEIAKGRIWTGEDAKRIGLVDELGGFPAALRLAKKAAGIPEEQEVRLEIFPPKRNPLQMLLEEGADSSEPQAATAVLARTLREIQPIARRVKMLGLLSDRGALSMPGFEATP